MRQELISFPYIMQEGRNAAGGESDETKSHHNEEEH
jgi:hypothetical protein